MAAVVVVDEQDKEAAAKGDHAEEAKGDHTEQAIALFEAIA